MVSDLRPTPDIQPGIVLLPLGGRELPENASRGEADAGAALVAGAGQVAACVAGSDVAAAEEQVAGRPDAANERHA